jgi:hypothetical protein
VSGLILPSGATNAGPFYNFRFGVAADYPMMLRAKTVAPGSPVFAARAVMEGGYPDVEIVIPISETAIAAHAGGDLSVMTTLMEELISEYRRFRGRVGS